MSFFKINSETLDRIANAINAKTGKTAALTPAQMVTEIGSISGGGGGVTPTGTIQISQNGTYNVTNYASADVNVSGGGGGGFELIAEHTTSETASIVTVPIPSNKQNCKLFKIIVSLEFNGQEYPYYGVNGNFTGYDSTRQKDTPYVIRGYIIHTSTKVNGEYTSDVARLVIAGKNFEAAFPVTEFAIKSYYSNTIKAGCNIKIYGQIDD